MPTCGAGRRQWGRGQTAAESASLRRSSSRPLSVNGAAARRPRKGRFAGSLRRTRSRQWGRGPDGRGKSPKECGARMLEMRRQMGPRPDGRGKPTRRRRRHRRRRASMGPRPDGRGKQRRHSREAGRVIAASMGPRPDGRGKFNLNYIYCIKPCVNGAAARRPRKELQAALAKETSFASMGPRPDGRGK